MKNFNSWGIRIRKDLTKNYYSIWKNLETVRLDLGEIKPLEPSKAEFYDVGITERCNVMCSFCYVDAKSSKQDYQNICETWKKFMSTFPEDEPVDFNNIHDDILLDILKRPTKENTLDEKLLKFEFQLAKCGKIPVCYTEKSFQIAIGSVGEPCVHPILPKFLETVYNTKVVPNYTTNGIILSDYDNARELFESTAAYCGGVAVSYGNDSIRKQANKAIENLLKYGNCKVMIHHIISDKNSVSKFLKAVEMWGKDVHYHVLLPLMAHGRSKEAMNDETFIFLSEQINNRNITNVAFGANFLPFMKNHPNSLNVWEYPQEVYSKNILLKDNKIVITPSSFNLTPINE